MELRDEMSDLVPEVLRSRWRSASGIVGGDWWLILGGIGGGTVVGIVLGGCC